MSWGWCRRSTLVDSGRIYGIDDNEIETGGFRMTKNEDNREDGHIKGKEEGVRHELENGDQTSKVDVDTERKD